MDIVWRPTNHAVLYQTAIAGSRRLRFRSQGRQLERRGQLARNKAQGVVAEAAGRISEIDQVSSIRFALMRRSTGLRNACTYRFQQRMAVALQSVTCTTIRGDGCVHFGDVLQLANVASAAFMTCDIEDRVSQLSHVLPLLQIFTMASPTTPCCRTLVLEISPVQQQLLPMLAQWHATHSSWPNTVQHSQVYMIGSMQVFVTSSSRVAEPASSMGARLPTCKLVVQDNL